MQESIIVYKNPLEKMFWEGDWGIIFVYFLAFTVPFVLTIWLLSSFWRQSYVQVFLGTVAGILGICLLRYFIA